jgi:hypothetical protein
MTRQIAGRKIRILPILIQECEIPSFLESKKWADFRDPSSSEASLSLLLRSLEVPPEALSPKVPPDRMEPFPTAALNPLAFYAWVEGRPGTNYTPEFERLERAVSGQLHIRNDIRDTRSAGLLPLGCAMLTHAGRNKPPPNQAGPTERRTSADP